MGRFDELTQLDKKPKPATPPPVKSEPVFSSVLPDNQFVGKPASTQTSLQANPQTRKPANTQARKDVKPQTRFQADPQVYKPASVQTRKDVSQQAVKPVNQQTRLQANPQASNQRLIVKYTTYLTPECKRALKRIAFESDRKDYEILIEAVEQYLGRQKISK